MALGEEEAKELAEQMNVISELVLGYREGTFGQIVQGVAALKVKANKQPKCKQCNDDHSRCYCLAA